jgi:hypothetical protein
MDGHLSIPVNIPGIYFQSQSCLDHSPVLTDWNPSDEISMNGPTWSGTSSEIFELPVDFHTLLGTKHPNERYKTPSSSVSVNVEPPSAKNQKVQ